MKIEGRKQASEGGKYRKKENAQKICIEIKIKYRRGWWVAFKGPFKGRMRGDGRPKTCAK